SVMEGRAFSGVSNYSAYVGTFSWFADVSFMFTSPWLVFSGTDARDANVTVVFRSLWKQLWKPDTQVTEKGSIYTVSLYLFNEESMPMHSCVLASANSIANTTVTIPLKEFFGRPMKFKIGIGGRINTMNTTLGDLWDEQIIQIGACSIQAFHQPTFVYSSLVTKWNGYEMLAMNAEATNVSAFGGVRNITLTNMPAGYSTAGSAGIFGAIATPITPGGTSSNGILDNYHFQADWRKTTQQTWGLGSADGYDYSSSTSTNFLNASTTMVSNAEANWRVQGSGTSQHTWAELVLRGAMRGTKYSWVGLGVEIQAPLVPGRIFASMQAHVELDIDTCIVSSSTYNITVAVQTASGLHVLRTYSKAEMPAGHRSIDLDLTPVITNATGIHYFMILLEGSPFGPLSVLRYIKARVESIEILATYIETGSYIGVSAAAGKDSVSFLSSPRAAGEWAYAITTYNDSLVPARIRFLGSGSITRLVRGGIADAGIYARFDAELVNVNGSILTCPIYSSWINPTT
nr:hypothetical protein [Candidatus Sigynarchaeota archaeon]